MNKTLRLSKRIQKALLCSSLLATGLGEFFTQEIQAQVVWEPVDLPKIQPSPSKWDADSESRKSNTVSPDWEVIPKPEGSNPGSTMVEWVTDDYQELGPRRRE